MNEQRNPVVASLPRSQHPLSSIALSPDRGHAVAAGKDTMRLLSVGPQGLRELRAIQVSQHFQVPVSQSQQQQQQRYHDIRDSFYDVRRNKPASSLGVASTNATTASSITAVAWSLPQLQQQDTSVVAVAGSNGVVVVWNARQTLLSPTSTNPTREAILSQHSRAVNKLAWHPTGRNPGLLLTASQDATVRLWERKISTPSEAQNSQSTTGSRGGGLRSWFGMSPSPFFSPNAKSVEWRCRMVFEPKSEAIRDIKWSPFHDDAFAIVTDTGSLIVYNMHVRGSPWVRTVAHDGEATSVDWHPTKPYIIATGGGGDRTVKIWDLERAMSLNKIKDDVATGISDLSSTCSSNNSFDESSNAKAGSRSSSPPSSSLMSTIGRSNKGTGGSVSSGKPCDLLHVLSISAAVTRLCWRPPAGPHVSSNIHGSMLAVATAPILGAGGNGVLSLWSYSRPFMALSTVEGHKEGAVTDFVWLDTPDESSPPTSGSSTGLDVNTGGTTIIESSEKLQHESALHWTGKSRNTSALTDTRSKDILSIKIGTPKARGNRSTPKSNSSRRMGLDSSISASDDDTGFGTREHSDRAGITNSSLSQSTAGTWQHVLSVGRDGKCILQSFARGDRPISRVSPSCFAMANLSPFQRGYGSLQIFSTHQYVPSGPADDFALTGLRQDIATSKAPGVFREAMIFPQKTEQQRDRTVRFELGQRLPRSSPRLVFNVIDQGDLDEHANPIATTNQNMVAVAPEVVHLSRFADNYKLYPDQTCTTRSSLCLHNASVAERLSCGNLARMWRMVATMLLGSDQQPSDGKAGVSNALHFALLPTLKSLLEERANAGDVQTCVALCEILRVFERKNDSEDTTVRIKGLGINYVREWYLSYIDLLQQMCLFSHASALIGRCDDPVIGALNKQSTTIHEACPHCGKPIAAGDGMDNSGAKSVTARRTCKSCRRRVGLCFLCHEPVIGVYVWCPGCGHGGHLDHALEWFGGIGGNPVREVCPTGCGHKCNLMQQLRAFPKTNSFSQFHPAVCPVIPSSGSL